jgi:hypothetical protein
VLANYGHLRQDVLSDFTGAEELYRQALALDPQHGAHSTLRPPAALRGPPSRARLITPSAAPHARAAGRAVSALCNLGMLLEDAYADYEAAAKAPPRPAPKMMVRRGARLGRLRAEAGLWVASREVESRGGPVGCVSGG